ncbi:hypothetical protein AAHB37_01000 [Glutamicibacter halophytocola]|uniref:hypothetical protein n=1 Tax=Glutamicibacter halophytocola TaxID=1933880 RepID=UPI0032190A7A
MDTAEACSSSPAVADSSAVIQCCGSIWVPGRWLLRLLGHHFPALRVDQQGLAGLGGRVDA